MYPSFFAEIEQFVMLSTEEKELIRQHLVPQQIAKGDFFLREGQTNPGIAFLQEGLIRSYYINEEGEEVTSGFTQPIAFFTDLTSYQNEVPSARNLRAILPCALLLLPTASLRKLSTLIPGLVQFQNAYYEKVLYNKVHFQQKLRQASAKKAYQLFIEQYPFASQYAPKHCIASFLGLSPYTLSRVRL